jgi:hypothetical protein
MRTIQTFGCPFLCVERCLAGLWRGIDGSSAGALATDYDRAGAVSGWLETIAVGETATGLVFNDRPLFTGIWRDGLGRPVVVRVEYMPHDQEEEPLVRRLEPFSAGNPIDSRQITFGSPDIIVFDSVYNGSEIGSADESTKAVGDLLAFRLEPGTYRVDVMKAVLKEERASLIIHPFTRLDWLSDRHCWSFATRRHGKAA